MTTAIQIWRGVTGRAASSCPAKPVASGWSGISGSTTPTIARNWQAVTTSPVSMRSVNWRIRPFECRTSMTEIASSTKYQYGGFSATGPVAYVSIASSTPIIPGLFLMMSLSQ